jgi:hypothetical protein
MAEILYRGSFFKIAGPFYRVREGGKGGLFLKPDASTVFLKARSSCRYFPYDGLHVPVSLSVFTRGQVHFKKYILCADQHNLQVKASNTKGSVDLTAEKNRE